MQRSRIGRMSPDARREQLLKAGMELFRHSSYEEISIDDIARAADVSKGLLYHYFPTKRDFVIAAVAKTVDELTALLTFDPSLSADEQADANIDAFLGYVENRSPGFATIFRTRGSGDPALARLIAEGRRQRMAFIIEGLARFADAPLEEIRTPVFEAAVEGWMFFAEGVMLRWLERRDIDRAQARRLMKAALLQVIPIAATAELQETTP